MASVKATLVDLDQAAAGNTVEGELNYKPSFLPGSPASLSSEAGAPSHLDSIL